MNSALTVVLGVTFIAAGCGNTGTSVDRAGGGAAATTGRGGIGGAAGSATGAGGAGHSGAGGVAVGATGGSGGRGPDGGTTGADGGVDAALACPPGETRCDSFGRRL